MANNVFKLEIKGVQDPPSSSAYDNFLSYNRIITQNKPQGSGDLQADIMVALETQIAGGGTASIDLKTDNDRYGVAAALDDCVLFFLEHLSSSSSSSIQFAAGAANGFSNLLSTTAAAKLKPGVFWLIGAFDLDSLQVTAANKTITLTNNDGGNAADFRFVCWGRR